jgi:hypothetical protein
MGNNNAKSNKMEKECTTCENDQCHFMAFCVCVINWTKLIFYEVYLIEYLYNNTRALDSIVCMQIEGDCMKMRAWNDNDATSQLARFLISFPSYFVILLIMLVFHFTAAHSEDKRCCRMWDDENSPTERMENIFPRKNENKKKES